MENKHYIPNKKTILMALGHTDHMHPSTFRFVLALAWFLVLIGGAGCQDKTDDVPLLSPIEGTWLSEGYGYALQVRSNQFTLFEETDDFCQPFSEGTFVDINNPIVSIVYPVEDDSASIPFYTELDGDTLHIYDSGTLAYDFYPAPLPVPCTSASADKNTDPEFNFQVFWDLFNDHYAFFDLYQVNWDEMFSTYSVQVSSSTTTDELFAIMTQMVTPLKDDHLFIAGESAEYGIMPSQEIMDHIEDIITYVTDFYLESENVKIVGNEIIYYQEIQPGVGYVLIDGMMGYGDIKSIDPIASELQIAGDAMDAVIADLNHTHTMIIDLRFNGGGLDAVSLELAGRFADTKRLAMTKHAIKGEGFTPNRELYVEPKGTVQYKGKVLLLTSNLTVSAAETFILAMRTLPNVTLIGEITAGAFSDILTHHLPNGWEIGLSNEVYTAADGNIYEYVGITPDIEVALNPAAFAENSDVIMERALQFIAESTE